MLWAALEASQDCVKLIGLDGRINYVNAGGCRLMELESPNDIVGEVWAEMWPEPSRAQVRAAVANGGAQRSDRFCAPRDTARGRRKHWDVVVTPLVDERGELEVLLVTSRDVSDLQSARAEAEEKRAALTKTTAALRAVGRVAKIGGWEISLESQLVDWSQEIWDILGGTPRPIQLDEALGIYPEAEQPRVRDLLTHAAATPLGQTPPKPGRDIGQPDHLLHLIMGHQRSGDRTGCPCALSSRPHRSDFVMQPVAGQID